MPWLTYLPADPGLCGCSYDMLLGHSERDWRMTIVEQRQHRRYRLLHQPVGQFRLQTATATYPIQVINDISSSGIRLYLDTSLVPRLPVAIEYAEPSLKLEVNGMVAWCATRVRGTDIDDPRGRFIIGIQLLSPMLLMAMSGT